MGGTGSAMKIMVGELTDKSTQGTAFSWLTISYRAGQVFGLPLGGYLAHPERHFSIFNHPFWRQYPFALPCFVAAFAAAMSVLMGCFYLEETLRSKVKKPSHSRQPSANDCNFPGSTQEERPQAVLGTVNTRKAPLKSVLSPPVISLLSSTTAMCLVSEMLFALYPLFAFTSIEAGGLGIDEATIGTHLAVRSLLPIPFMVFFPVLQKRLGTTRMYQMVLSTIPIVVFFFPYSQSIGSRWRQCMDFKRRFTWLLPRMELVWFGLDLLCNHGERCRTFRRFLGDNQCNFTNVYCSSSGDSTGDGYQYVCSLY